MALTQIEAVPRPNIDGARGMPNVNPSSGQSDWIDLLTDLLTTDGGTGGTPGDGSNVLQPGLVTRAAARIIDVSLWTSLEFRMKYDKANIPGSAPVIQLFGFDVSINGAQPELGVADSLFDGSSPPSQFFTMTTASGTTDVQWLDVAGVITWAATASQFVDCLNAKWVMACVKTKTTAAGTNKPTIQVRPL